MSNEVCARRVEDVVENLKLNVEKNSEKPSLINRRKKSGGVGNTLTTSMAGYGASTVWETWIYRFLGLHLLCIAPYSSRRILGKEDRSSHQAIEIYFAILLVHTIRTMCLATDVGSLDPGLSRTPSQGTRRPQQRYLLYRTLSSTVLPLKPYHISICVVGQLASPLDNLP